MKTIAIFVTKLVAALLHLVHRGGSFPGQCALRLCPNILKKVSFACPIIFVSGTNGKTSTANMISDTLEIAGKRVITNRKGDNLKAGITTALLRHASYRGKIKADYVVLEVDELNIPYMIQVLPVTILVFTNFFRDQLDRAREMEQLIQRVEKGIHDFSGTLILNGNDPNVVRLAYVAKNATTMYYGIKRCTASVAQTKEASEGKFCPLCGSRLQYQHYQYSHIGEFACCSCDFKSPTIHCLGQVMDIKKRLFSYQDNTFCAPQDGLYTMYNCMAVLCVMECVHIAYTHVMTAFKNFTVPDGRNETFSYHGNRLVINLIKNPTGANEVMKVIEADHNDKTILIVLNDADQDGRDISWIYDTNFESILQANTLHIITAGTRCYDMALRLTYSGYDKAKLTVCEELSSAIKQILTFDTTMYVIATYTALQPSRNLIIANINNA